MVSVSRASFQYRGLVTLCAAAVLCSLAAHLAADTADIPPELAEQLARGRIAADEHITRCELLGEIALPAVAVTLNLPLLALLVNSPSLISLNWVLPPPIRPPIIVC